MVAALPGIWDHTVWPATPHTGECVCLNS